MAQGKLSDEAKTYVVQALACFETPSEVAEAVNREFGVEITKQSVEKYDPTKVAGANVAKRWRQLFEATRKAFLEDTATIAISHRAVRLKALQRMAEKAERMKNYPLAAQLYEQAAKEVGDAYTNRRQLTGANGKPLIPPTVPVTPGMTPQQAAEAYQALLNAGEE